MNVVSHKVLALLALFFSVGVLEAQALYPPWQLAAAAASIKTPGMTIPQTLVYHPSNTSLSAVVAKLSNGDAGVLVSSQGLLLLSASSLEAVDFVAPIDTFLVLNGKEEIPIPGLSATFLIRVEDVTQQATSNLADSLSEEQRQFWVDQNLNRLRQTYPLQPQQDLNVLQMLSGRQYLFLLTETFTDLRLVFGIKNGGIDSTNFALVRIYASSSNAPSTFQNNNRPYRPRKVARWSNTELQVNDPVFALGFPQKTDYHLPSSWLASLASDDITVEKKAYLEQLSRRRMVPEQEFQYQVDHNEVWRYRYGSLLRQMRENVAAWELYRQAHAAYVQLLEVEGSWIKLAAQLDYYIQAAENDQSINPEGFKALLDNINKRFLPVDQTSLLPQLAHHLEQYYRQTPGGLLSPVAVNALINANKDYEKLSERLLQKTALAAPANWIDRLTANPTAQLKALSKDEGYYFWKQIKQFFQQNTQPEYLRLQEVLLQEEALFERAQAEVFPDQWFSPNADGQLRLAFGKVNKAADGFFWQNAFGAMEGFAGSPIFDKNGGLLGIGWPKKDNIRSQVYDFSPALEFTPAWSKRGIFSLLNPHKEAKYLLEEMNK